MTATKKELFKTGLNLIFGINRAKSKITTINQLTIMTATYLEPGIQTPDLTSITNLTGAGLRGRVAYLIKTGLMFTELRRAKKMGAPLRAHFLTEAGAEVIESLLKGVRS